MDWLKILIFTKSRAFIALKNTLIYTAVLTVQNLFGMIPPFAAKRQVHYPAVTNGLFYHDVLLSGDWFSLSFIYDPNLGF